MNTEELITKKRLPSPTKYDSNKISKLNTATIVQDLFQFGKAANGVARNSNPSVFICDVDNKENYVNTLTSNEMKNVLSNTKKLIMTDTEKAMDGAPQGEIFDVTVMMNEDIAPSTNPKEELELALKSMSDTSTAWAERHSAIESARRIVLHHISELVANPSSLPVIIKATIDSVASLRSSTSRNAILCLGLIIESQTIIELSIDQLISILISLMNRTAVGPKFVADSAYSVILNSIEHVQFLSFFDAIKV